MSHGWSILPNEISFRYAFWSPWVVIGFYLTCASLLWIILRHPASLNAFRGETPVTSVEFWEAKFVNFLWPLGICWILGENQVVGLRRFANGILILLRLLHRILFFVLWFLEYIIFPSFVLFNSLVSNISHELYRRLLIWTHYPTFRPQCWLTTHAPCLLPLHHLTGHFNRTKGLFVLSSRDRSLDLYIFLLHLGKSWRVNEGSHCLGNLCQRQAWVATVKLFTHDILLSWNRLWPEGAAFSRVHPSVHDILF